MISNNFNGISHQLIKLAPKEELLVEGGVSAGKTGEPTKVDITQDAIDGFNTGSKTIDELKAALDSSGVKYEDNGSSLKFEYNNKTYTITYKTDATNEKTLDQVKKEMGLRDTFYKGIYCEANKPGGEQKHYFWDENNNKMVEIPNVFYVSSDGHEVKDFITNYLAQTKAESSTTAAIDSQNQATQPEKKWEGNVDKKLKELEAQLKKIETKIKNNGGKVSAEMQKELNEIKTLISQIKNEDSKNIDMGKLKLDLNSIPGYSTNTKNIIKKDVNAGKAEAQSILNGLKDKMKAQLKEQAESLGIPESDFQTMFDRVFTVASNYAIRNEVDVRDVAGKLLDKVTYKVASLVNGFLNKFSSLFKDQVESWKDKNPNESVQNKFEELENKLGAVNKEVTSDVNSKVSINKDNLGLNNILGYSTNTKNKISGKKLNNGEAIYNEAKSVLNQTKEALYKQMSSQANALGIPDADFEKIFNNAFSTSVARAVDKHVNVLNLPGKFADTGSYKVKNLVDGFLEIFNTKINKDIVKYQLEH